jgi:hypothetical protein
MRRSVRRRLDRLLAAAKEPEPAPAVTAPVQNGARIMIDHEEKLYEAFRAHHEMEDIIRYLVDGRSCAHESDEDLESRWLGAWEDFFLYGSSFAAETYFDTSAELRLRGLALPEECITASMRKQAIANFRDTWNRPHVQKRLSADLNRFFREWEKPRN